MRVARERRVERHRNVDEFHEGAKSRMIAQRSSLKTRLKCCIHKGLTCPEADAYDGCSTATLFWESWLYDTAAPSISAFYAGRSRFFDRGPRASASKEGRQEGRQEQEDRLRVRRHRLRTGRRRPDADADFAIVHRARRQLRRLPDRQRAHARQGAQERAAAEGVGREAHRRRAGLLERR